MYTETSFNKFVFYHRLSCCVFFSWAPRGHSGARFWRCVWFLRLIIRMEWVPRFSAQMCPRILVSTSSKLAGGRLAEVGNFWQSARPLGKVARLVNFYCKAVGGRTKLPQNALEQRKKPQIQCNTLLIYLCREVWRSWFIWGKFQNSALS